MSDQQINAKATFIGDDFNSKTISITIGGEEQELSIDDCVSFEKDIGKEEEDLQRITAKIEGFHFKSYNKSESKYVVTQISYRLWRAAENRWSTGLQNLKLLPADFNPKTGIWTTLIKLTNCPDQKGGKRKTSRAKKSKRKTRRC